MIALHVFLVALVVLGVVIILITKDIVHAAYALGLALIGLAGVYVLLSAELLAVVQLMLYAGGVVILLVFGVMMTHRMRGEKVVSGSGNHFLAGVISAGLFGVLVFLINQTSFKTTVPQPADQIKTIGVSFLTDHIVAFELIAFILLVALVGAAYLAKQASNE